jgi:signal transduction histidine kinase
MTGRPYMSNHAAGDPGILQGYVEVLHVNRLMSVPLLMAGKPIGVLHLANKPTPFTSDDLAKAEALAPRIATAVELGRTVFELRRQRRLEGILSDIAVGIASGRSMQDLLARPFEELCEVIEACMVALTPRGLPPVVWRRGRRAHRLESALIDEARSFGPARSYAVQPSGAGDPGCAGALVPVTLSGKRIATLAAMRRRGEPFAADEHDALSRIANLAALAWATERYQQQRAELARLRERQRIADDLHDTVAQMLFAARLSLESVLETDGVEGRTRDSIEHTRALLLKGDSAIRTVIHELSRPARADLAHRLALLVGALEEEFRLRIHLEIPDGVATAAKTMRRPLADTMVKVAQEAIINAAKHAGPCRVGVTMAITRSGRLQLVVVDDGVGATHARSGQRHGLASLRRTLRDHGGLLRVSSGRYGGIKVSASVPL